MHDGKIQVINPTLHALKCEHNRYTISHVSILLECQYQRHLILVKVKLLTQTRLAMHWTVTDLLCYITPKTVLICPWIPTSLCTIKWLEVLMVCIMNMFKSFTYNGIEWACFKHMVFNCIWWVTTVCFKVCTSVQTPTSLTGYSSYVNSSNYEQNNIQLCGDHIKTLFHITSLFLRKYMRGE